MFSHYFPGQVVVKEGWVVETGGETEVFLSCTRDSRVHTPEFLFKSLVRHFVGVTVRVVKDNITG